MGSVKLERFEQEWDRSQKEPSLKEVEVERIEVDFSLSAMLDRFLVFAEQAVEQGKIKKADFDDLVLQCGNLRKVLARIDDKALVAGEMQRRARRRGLRSQP